MCEREEEEEGKKERKRRSREKVSSEGSEIRRGPSLSLPPIVCFFSPVDIRATQAERPRRADSSLAARLDSGQSSVTPGSCRGQRRRLIRWRRAGGGRAWEEAEATQTPAVDGRGERGRRRRMGMGMGQNQPSTAASFTSLLLLCDASSISHSITHLIRGGQGGREPSGPASVRVRVHLRLLLRHRRPRGPARVLTGADAAGLLHYRC